MSDEVYWNIGLQRFTWKAGDLINALMKADTIKEVINIVDHNADFFEINPNLYVHVHNAKRRINRIRKEKMKSYNLSELN
jgi:hypothetical protein